MLRDIIEYLRNKKKITILDLTVEICSQSMYYKYLDKTKNLCPFKVQQLKERLGANLLTTDEVSEYHQELSLILTKMIRFAYTYQEYIKVVDELEDLETQLMLNEELVVDYLLIKISKYFSPLHEKEYLELLDLLSKFTDSFTDFQKLYYNEYLLQSNKLDNNEKIFLIKQSLDIIFRIRDKTDFGYFYYGYAIVALNISKQKLAIELTHLAIEAFKNDVNMYGLIKSVNIEAFILLNNDDVDKALPLLLDNYERIKQSKCNFELLSVLVNIFICYSYKSMNKEINKYYKIILNLIPQYGEQLRYAKRLSIMLIFLISSHSEDRAEELINEIRKYYQFDFDELTNL